MSKRLPVRILCSWWLLASLLVPLQLFAGGEPDPLPPQAAIVSADALATAAGFAMLDAGGNAFDAAVAVSAALAVVEPFSTGLGGGGFWLLHREEDAFDIMIDGRERAPLAASRDMYLDADGQVIHRASLDGPLAAAIPGFAAGLVHMAERYGKLSIAQSLAPAIRLARNGFVVDDHYRTMAKLRRNALLASFDADNIFLDDGAVPELGWTIRQPELARTLALIARFGHAGFYAGEVATRLVDAVRDAGGVWSAQDLAAYEVVEREPVRGTYKGVRITSAALPSSGGVVLQQMLNILADLDIEKAEPVTRIHLLVEVMRRAYRDRARWMGDTDFVDVPQSRLLSESYAALLCLSIDRERATPSDAMHSLALNVGGRDTSHFSILDRQGNRVAGTVTINYPFGSGFVVPGTGVLLNNEMDDFSIRPGVPNTYGLVGNKANAIAPGKRPLSSMLPTFLETSDRTAILGTPGGSRIISMMLLVVLDFAAGHNSQSWVSLPRFHHQYLPDEVQFEPGALSLEQQRKLKALGHHMKPLNRPYGNMQAILWDRSRARVEAASDPRGSGSAIVR